MKADRYYDQHRDERLTYFRGLYDQNKRTVLMKNRKYALSHPDKVKDHQRAHRQRLRQKFLDIYGHRCQCDCGCNELVEGFLTVGHRNDDGAIDRRDGGNMAVLRRATAHPDLQKYMTVCYNCNSGQHEVNPHQANWKWRTKFFGIYGSVCQCSCGCQESRVGFLTVGHLHGEGRIDRRHFPGPSIVVEAVKHPDHSRFTTLCWDCNAGSDHNCGVCPRESLNRNRHSDNDSEQSEPGQKNT